MVLNFKHRKELINNMNVIKHFVNNTFANVNPELNNKYYVLVKKKNVGNSDENER